MVAKIARKVTCKSIELTVLEMLDWFAGLLCLLTTAAQ